MAEAGFASLRSVSCELNQVGFRLLIAEKVQRAPFTITPTATGQQSSASLTQQHTVHSAPQSLPTSAQEAWCLGAVSSFGYAGTIAHALLRRGTMHCPRVYTQHAPLIYRRHSFAWREPLEAPSGPEAHRPLHLSPRWVSSSVVAEHATREARVADRLITLSWQESMQVAIITLDDPSHFNALGGAAANDLLKSLEHAMALHASIRGVVLQAAGTHFCIGGNPYSKDEVVSFLNLAGGLHSLSQSCCKLREVSCAVVAAVHGHLVGGGVALCLNASYVMAEASTTFEHGNVIRGELSGLVL